MSNSNNLEKLEKLMAMFKGTSLTVQDLSKILSDHDYDLNATIVAILNSRPSPRKEQKESTPNEHTLTVDTQLNKKPEIISPLSNASDSPGSGLLRSFSEDSGSCNGSIDSGGSEGKGKWQRKYLKAKSQEMTDQHRDDNSSRGGRRRFANRIGNAFQRVNLYRMIGNLEESQMIADQLEQINQENEEEEERKEQVRQAEAACLKTIYYHLQEFLDKNQKGTYEEWIQELHPENAFKEQKIKVMNEVDNESLPEDDTTAMIDHRFYVEESDHRKLWNDHVELLLNTNNGILLKKVPPRYVTVFSKNGDLSIKRIESQSEKL